MADLGKRTTLYLNRLFSLAESEAHFSRRGFAPAEAQKQAHLENIGTSFLCGYNLGLKTGEVDALCATLDQVGHDMRGFAYEGAAMSLALTDNIWHPAHSRWQQLLEGAGAGHKYMLYVGYGWALARLPWLRRRPGALLARYQSVEKWLILDGYGFHEGYFRPAETFAGRIPKALFESEIRTFDQGVGRSIWFATGANVDRTAQTIRRFHLSRHGDLWSGIGLAASYAGGVDTQELEQLRTLAAGFEEHLAQGSAFATQARRLAGADLAVADKATRVFCGSAAEEAADVTSLALEMVGRNRSSHAAYEQWRADIRAFFPANSRVAHPARRSTAGRSPVNTVAS